MEILLRNFADMTAESDVIEVESHNTERTKNGKMVSKNFESGFFSSFLLLFLLLQTTIAFRSSSSESMPRRSSKSHFMHQVVQHHETFSHIVASFSLLREKHSLEVSAAIYGIGDGLVQLQQQLRSRQKGGGSESIGIDFRRLSLFTLVGGLFVAPIVGNWFKLLDTIPAKIYGDDVSHILKSFTMVAIDQVFASVVILTLFYYAYELINSLLPPYNVNNSLKNWYLRSKDTVQSSLWDTLCANWKFWPLLNFLIFTQVPLDNRLVASNIVAVFWNMYLSQKAHATVTQRDQRGTV